jgi:ferredoxin, 2Fe-2S
MVQIQVVEFSGAIHDVQALEGQTLLQATLDAGIDGFAAECGGCCVCATCHCMVQPEALERLTPIASDEDQMLDFTAEPRQPNSRLACQIKITAEHEGIQFFIPKRQY